MPPRPGETEIEMVQRQVHQGKGHVASQREVVSRLSPDSDLAETARLFLAALEETLASHRAHLARLQGSDWDATGQRRTIRGADFRVSFLHSPSR